MIADPTPVIKPSLHEVRAWWSAGAWHRLVPHLHEVMRRAVPRTYLIPADDLEDMVADCVVKCWTLGFTPENPDAYASTMIRNLSRDMFKSKRWQNKESQSDADIDEAADDTSVNSLDMVVHAENMNRLKASLHKLPDWIRRPLVLHDFHYKKHAEIAKQLGITEGTSKMRVHRARKMLGEIYVKTLPVPDTVEPKKRGRPKVHRCRCGEIGCKKYTGEDIVDSVVRSSPQVRAYHLYAGGFV